MYLLCPVQLFAHTACHWYIIPSCVHTVRIAAAFRDGFFYLYKNPAAAIYSCATASTAYKLPSFDLVKFACLLPLVLLVSHLLHRSDCALLTVNHLATTGINGCLCQETTGR